jgi:hypothetical protein
MLRSPYVIATTIELVLFLVTALVFRQRGLHGAGALMGILLVTQLPGVLGGMLIGQVLHASGANLARLSDNSVFLGTMILATQVVAILAIVWLVRRLRRASLLRERT